MAERLSASMRERLDALVAVGDDDPHSPLHRIKTGSSSPHGCNLGLYTMEKVAPASPTGGSSTSAIGVSSRRTSAPRSPPSSTASPASTPPAIGATARRRPATGSASPCRRRCCSGPSSSTPSSQTTTPRSTAARSSAPTATRPSCSTASSTTRATSISKSTTPTPTATPRSTSRPSGWSACGFCPRIRSLHRQRIYCADQGRNHGGSTASRPRTVVNPQEMQFMTSWS